MALKTIKFGMNHFGKCKFHSTDQSIVIDDVNVDSL